MYARGVPMGNAILPSYPQVKKAIGTTILDENEDLFTEAAALADILGDIQLSTKALVARQQLVSNPQRKLVIKRWLQMHSYHWPVHGPSRCVSSVPARWSAKYVCSWRSCGVSAQRRRSQAAQHLPGTPRPSSLNHTQRKKPCTSTCIRP